MTEHEKRLMNQAPCDPRRRRRNSEPSDDLVSAKKKATVVSDSKTETISFTCKWYVVIWIKIFVARSYENL